MKNESDQKLRTLTDIDILAFRFPYAGKLISSVQSNHQSKNIYKVDERLLQTFKQNPVHILQ